MKKLLLGLLLCSVGFWVSAEQIQRDKEYICENHSNKEQCLSLLDSMVKAAVAAGDAKGACDIMSVYNDQPSEDDKAFCEKARNRVKEFMSK